MLDFDKVIEKITSFLKAYNFFVVENHKNNVKYVSTKTSIVIGYDEREYYYFAIVGDKSNISIPLDVNNLTNVFQYDSEKFIRSPFEEFFIDFFMTTNGNLILTGDRTIFEALKRDRDKRAEEYTRQLLQRQNLDSADKAWLSNNYLEFVKHLDLIDKSSLLQSYELKYSIAKRKLNE
jgi:hypothetical protein